MICRNRNNTFFIIFLSCLTACSSFTRSGGPDPLFKNLSPAYTGITFDNTIAYNKHFNILNFPYIYNGGGVAVGDINNDGLTDIYFTGNRVSSRLYLNKGALQFKDITQSSGTSTQGWASGTAMVDINNDGYQDIYVSLTGPKGSTAKDRANLLFINNKDETFTESAQKFGLADTGFTTQAAFFDYDGDKDLDVFLINNYVGSFYRDSKLVNIRDINDNNAKSRDVLYRNNGNGTFTNVSGKVGIIKKGYSLGVAINDINRDGWPDIYISNDIQSEDVLYINNGDGTFTDKAAASFKHTSYAGMGTDIADFNNDGWPDVLEAEMKPATLQDQKLNYEHYNQLKQNKQLYQSTQNTLQLSNGVDEQENVIFSEISYLAGISSTNWSWSALFADFDNDGLKDIMITNGYPKDVINYDYQNRFNRLNMFGTDSVQKERGYKIMDDLQALKIPNYFFKNNGDLTFSDVSKKWGFSKNTFSYGAAYADLDNDGDLDIAINNINDKAQILQNRADSTQSNNYLSVCLKGDSLNLQGLGSKIILTANGEKQYQYVNPYRGYQSSMNQKINFGIGSSSTVDSLEIIWPDGHYQLATSLEANQTFIAHYKNAQLPDLKREKAQKSGQHWFSFINGSLGISYKHQENKFSDFDKQPLLPRMLSRLGPAVATGDVNGDNREDIFLGGATGFGAKLFIQQSKGTFKESDQPQAWENDKAFEDIDATFFDANGDDNEDLYVVSGGNKYSPASKQLQDRLYLNTGNGTFIKAENRLPRMFTSGSTVKPADYDDDGDIDLFVAGRLVPGQYPRAARSYILRNDDDKFTDVTANIAPDLVKPGMLTDATWVDSNEDGHLDLVTTGLWMPVRFFKNESDHFHEVTASVGLGQQKGWWQSIEKADLDGDGDIDFVVGNYGLNSPYSTSGNTKLHLFANDFDTNGRLDAILALKKESRYYPLHGLRTMNRQIPLLSRKIQSFEQYGQMSLGQLTKKDLENKSIHLEANNFKSSIIINNGDNTFSMSPLPDAAQISSINDIQVLDINRDNKTDLIVAGNIYNANPEIPRYDAGNGLVLLGDGEGNFDPVSPFDSGFMASLNVRKLAIVHTTKSDYLFIVNNEGSLKVMTIKYERVENK